MTEVIPFTRDFFDAGLAFMAVMGLLNAALMVWQVRGPHQLRQLPIGSVRQVIAVMGWSAAAALALTGQVMATALTAILSILVSSVIRWRLPQLTMVGALAMSVAPVSLMVVTPWSYCFLRDSGFPIWSLTLWKFFLALSLLGLGFSFASKLAVQALLTHGQWRRPTGPLPRLESPHPPFISLHLCCYSEPPDVVMRALDHLARMAYTRYEVLVCDNNTEDPALWKPLQAHCLRLNEQLGFERFRFFHIAPLAGAKAGALNFCLDHTAPEAELIGVLDADYLARPDFLSRLVGFFDNPRIGYVQTSHDYRGQRFSRYLRMCYWEYLPYYKVDMASINEYGAGFTIGTMCLLRRQALEDCGRWAEWCLTEDSEVSIRIRALGYEGLFLRSTFGRGLIPEQFEHYKKQRFRWAAGPVQQLRRHWRLFLPRVLGGHGGLSAWSKLLEFQRAFECMVLGPAMLLGLAGTFAFLALTATGHLPPIVVPAIVWQTMPLAIASLLLSKWQWYRLGGCHRLRDMLGGELARLSLFYVKLCASFAGLSGRPLKWHRTPKFKATSLGARALLSALPETLIGLAFLLLAIALLLLRAPIGPHLALLASIGALWAALTFWSATAMAVLSELELAGHTRKQLDTRPSTALQAPSLAASEQGQTTRHRGHADHADEGG